MGREFEERSEAEVPASPEQVWDAIASGPGIDSWFMGRNEVDPGEGGQVRTSFGGYQPTSPITGWQPLRRLAFGGEADEDGRFVAYEFLIEGRAGGSTVLRMVTSGFLPGDDWADELDAMAKGTAMFFRTLVEYLTHFAGRTATPVTAFGPPVDDWERTWAALHGALGLSGPPGPGDPVRISTAGHPPADGVVYFANPHTLGVRTGDALYRFLQGFQGPLIAAHHLFSHPDRPAAEAAWQAWLHQLTNPTQEDGS